MSALLDSDPDYLDQIIQLNVAALTRLALSAATAFVGRGHGLIINIDSVVSLAPEMLNGTCSGSKEPGQSSEAPLQSAHCWTSRWKGRRYASTGNPFCFHASIPPNNIFTFGNPSFSAVVRTVLLLASLGQVQ